MHEVQHALLQQLGGFEEKVGVCFALLQVDFLEEWSFHQVFLFLGQAAEVVEEGLGSEIGPFWLVLEGFGDAVDLFLHGSDQLERGFVAIASSFVSLLFQHSQPFLMFLIAPLFLSLNAMS